MADTPIKVLLVEDNPGDARLIQEILGEVTAVSFVMTTVERLSTALDSLARESFDVVLLDLSLPDSQGLATFSDLHGRAHSVPVVVLTGLDDEAFALKAVQAGAQDYLFKGQANGDVLSRAMRYAIERNRAEEALRESEERFRLLVEGVKDYALFTIDPSGYIVNWNAGAEKLQGYTAEEILGQHISCFCTPEDLLDGKPQELLRIAAAEGRVVSEGWRLRKDGTKFWASVILTALQDETGKLRGFSKVTRDITERRNAEEALRESEARFRRVSESNMIGIIFANVDGQITEANDAFLDMVGYSHDDLSQGRLDWNAMTPQEYEALDQQAIAELFDSGVCTPFEKEYIRKDGRRVPILLGITFLEGSRTHCVAFTLDLTERKRAEQKIREQAALLDIGTDAIIVRGLNHQILLWTKGAERLYGWKSAEVVGHNVDELLYKQESPVLRQAKASVTEKGEWKGELQQVTQAGKDIIVESRWTLVRDAQDNPRSILVVNTDITDKKQLEAQFLRAQRMESIGTLASGIAHDLNNVLSPILMSVQLLQKKFSDERSQQLLKTLEASAKRGADLVKQVLSFARGLEGERTILQVKHLILEIEKIVKQTLPKSIVVQTNIPNDLWTVSGDATQLHQVLMNLCVNARDAMPNGGVLRLEAENLVIDDYYARMNLDAKVGPYLRVTVADTGTGIPPEILDRVFEPFFTTKDIGKGTGLGLSTVIGIIRSHGGFITVDSQPGSGTQFKVYLPAVKALVQRSPSETELPVGHGELILVVDDEPSIREMTKASLETYDYQALTANDGIEAIMLYAKYKDQISVVLTDMMMPSMDGPTTIRTLQKMNPQIKIIAVSGLSTNDKVAEAIGTGVSKFLAKPYTTKELLTTLHHVLHS